MSDPLVDIENADAVLELRAEVSRLHIDLNQMRGDLRVAEAKGGDWNKRTKWQRPTASPVSSAPLNLKSERGWMMSELEIRSADDIKADALRDEIRKFLSKCSEKSRKGFDRIFPEGLDAIEGEKLPSVLALVHRSYKKDSRKASGR